MENQQPEFGFNVLRILDCGFAIEETVEVDPENTTVGYGMNLGSNINESWVQINIRTDFYNAKTNQIFATGTVLTKFGINNLRAFADEKGETITWPPAAIQSMFGIAFTHMRAIVAKNMAGSKFNEYIIPLVNPGTLFQELHERNMKIHEELLKHRDLKPEDKPEEVEKANRTNIDDLYDDLPRRATEGKISKITKKKTGK